MGIKVLQPDVNESQNNFAPVGSDIRFGLGAVRNVGSHVVEAIVEAREEKGRFESFSDFLNKVGPQALNKRTIESLIKAGAFDDLGHHRRALTAIHEDAVDQAMALKRHEAAHQFDLFSMSGDESLANALDVEIPDIPEWDKKEKLSLEREMLGLYVSDHPLQGLSLIHI